MPGRASSPGLVAAALGGGAAPFLVLCLALAPTLARSTEPPVQGNGASACRGVIDAVRSAAVFDVRLRLPIRARGRFDRVEGRFEGTPWACTVTVALDTADLHFDGPPWMDRLTRSPAFLDAEAHPRLRFEADPFPASRLNDGGPLRGRLRLRGIERPVDFTLLPHACHPAGTLACPLRVHGEIPRRDFGMTAYRATVRDLVAVEFAIVLEDAPR
jgi:polyisoprenoid-binding protein YceI